MGRTAHTKTALPPTEPTFLETSLVLFVRTEDVDEEALVGLLPISRNHGFFQIHSEHSTQESCLQRARLSKHFLWRMCGDDVTSDFAVRAALADLTALLIIGVTLLGGTCLRVVSKPTRLSTQRLAPTTRLNPQAVPLILRHHWETVCGGSHSNAIWKPP